MRALARGDLEPVPPRRAATVMLLRDSPAGPVVHLLRRRASMAFAAGAYAYPGGSVDPRDEHPHLRWAGPDADWWARRLGCGPRVAQAVVCAAVRETFEESGVLLAGPDADSVVADTTGDDWEADRAALVAHELPFAEVLARRGLVLRSDLLGAWARWITPEFEERRYDTWFFVCALPSGQRARDVSGEADRTVWLSPAEAVARYDAGEFSMLPPTVSTLRQLAGHRSARAVLDAAGGQDMAPVLATARIEADRVVLTWPGHDEFTEAVPFSGPVPGAGR
ncbi:NUDIX hydrolase [Wenjunlia vitaminophila]|uniref:NUDIX hydrolase n=1 Tax=Wenjunlia vitaminophila TaxID=76728 RepID=A0A0T6LNY9_WENVI|nr:NUDIX hydrolase [Wenjunlia vitaminophila]